MESWVSAVGLDFIVNSVVTADGRIAAVAAGHYVAAHRHGVELAQELYGVRLPRKADVVLVTSFRADEDFWLASKAIFAGDLAVRDGGTLILLTPCKEGIGPHPQYADYCGEDDCERLAQEALCGRVAEPIAVSAAVAIAKMRRRMKIWIVSDGLTVADAARMKCRHFADANEALTVALREHGPRAQVAVFPDGINTVPMIDPEGAP
jgi:nickel-dependent lactate racemase